MMQRWPLSCASAWLVVLAHLVVAASASAAEPTPPGRPYRATGEIASRPPGFVLITPMGVEIVLLPRPRDAGALRRIARTSDQVRVEGLYYESTFRPYLLVESIKENP